MRRNKILLLVASLASLAVLGWAAFEENLLREWRQIQERYRRAQAAAGEPPSPVMLRQVVVPALRAADRCVSCHVGMAPGEMGAPGDPLFRQHPDVVHDPGDFGCVVCHGGQGRATRSADAHGTVPHWPEPMLARGHAYAGCGTCHTHLAVPDAGQLAEGRARFERHDCLACHRMEGRGGTLRPDGGSGLEGPDLTRAGAKGYDRGWHGDHLARRDTAPEPAWRVFAPVPEADRTAIEVYLDSRLGAPGLVEGKALFFSKGCLGCHKVGGVGGDDGPDLTVAGQRDPALTDFTHVPGERTIANWIAEHFRAPAQVVPGSLMPEMGLTEDEIEALTFYVLSLRRSAFPEAFWPKDRIRAERFGEREFATDGATLYGTFCAACHGARGEGMRYAGMAPFPAVANPDFLVLASDAFIAETVKRGRPGRRMPAWGEKEGGLRPAEIEAVVSHIRTVAGIPEPVDPKPPRWVSADAAEGARLYAASCAGCHGANGQGAEGTALANPVLLSSATDTYLVETIRRGRRGTSMEGYASSTPTRSALSDAEIESVVTYIRQWEKTP
jgi:mono/diheme cytochrome c family protein